jgi:hypothetical protein
MLVIEIAIGVVLGWILIKHFDGFINSIVGFTIGFFKIIFYPFKIIWTILREVYLLVYEVFYGVVATVLKAMRLGLPLALFAAAAVLIVVGFFNLIFNFIPQPYSRYLFWLIFGSGLLYGIFVFLKDEYENYKNNDSSRWAFVAFFGLVICIFIVALAVRGIASIFT